MALRLLVIGGGISGLSLAHALSSGSDIELTVLEAESRPGGKIWTERVDGFLCESGVNGFLDNKPRTLELAALLSLPALRSSDAARKRFIYSGGALERLPENPAAFLKSGLISLPGKLRLGIEPFIRRKKNGGDESLADFARRRLGGEAYEKLIDPMASGIYAGDPEALSLRSCFPRIHELEERYGSLVMGMLRLMVKRRKAVSAAPAGVLTSFMGGMEDMIDALRGRLGPALRVKSGVLSVERAGGGYAVHLAGGDVLEADIVALAVPAYRAAEILKGLDGGISDVLAGIPYPPLTVVALGFGEGRLKGDFESFGFLVPGREGRKVLGTLFDSSIFPGRATEGCRLLRSMVGGARAPHLAGEDDEKITRTVLAELREIAGIGAEPDFVRVYRHEKAIPQYTLGHGERLRELEEMLTRHKGLYITGNALRGISVNDCIENSFRLAEKILTETA